MIETKEENIPSTEQRKVAKPQEEKIKPLACNIFESCVIKAPIGSVWDTIKAFQADKIFPSQVSSCKFTSGSSNEIGSLYEVCYKDGSTCTFRIV